MTRAQTILRRLVVITLFVSFALITSWFDARLLADDCPDAWITVKVKTLLLADDGLDALKIDVDTRVCVVDLYGCVDTKKQKKQAGTIASSVKKVKTVKNHLKICPKD